ncbi:hypothetical protein DSOUD_2504 [Desulfuromonas soudanensis]|uniref:SbsA Ig-like domain-containing protein n=1 Tax=Desulfuromonas soudanensis TaxID=1603606 RepID=A0A0M4DJH4_9BACT|nr:Ig-like domain-containing protein [Desulfuromonas soudanensis]ALC17257.1 hypothetical protein DSOUD_2504 [Desulfuromonas soudanensis]
MKGQSPGSIFSKTFRPPALTVSLSALLLSTLLVACGGGGGDSAPTTPVTPTITYLAAPAVSPAGGATDISVSTSISADFSEALDPASAATAMILKNSGGAVIPAEVVCLGSTLTSFPASSLAYGETYTVTIGTGLKGMSGDHLELPKTWSFTTVSASPGDPLTYFPTDNGRTWEFTGTINTSPFVNTLTISGTDVVNGITVDVYTESNRDDDGLTMKTYRLKDGDGLWYYGTDDPADTLTPLLAPYREMVFPLTPGAGQMILAKTGIDYGQDEDGDGINETCDVAISTLMEKFEDLSLPAGNFTATAKINTLTQIEITLSRDGSAFVVQEWNSKWYAPGIGPVKRDSLFSTPLGITRVIEELSAFTAP